ARAWIIIALLMISGIAVVGRLVQLQIVQHDHWLTVASAIQEQTVELPPRRGTIYDRIGVALAYDVKASAIAIDSFDMTNPEAICQILSEELARPIDEIRRLVYRPRYFTWIDRSVDLEAAKAIEQRVAEANANGLIFIDTWKRCYPQGDLASNIIGFVGMDGHGLEGIELAYDDELAGTSAQVHVVKGADGRTYHTETLQDGEPGDDVYLTIDSNLQFICEEEIDSGVSRFRANTGFVILLDPNTGDVLAMAQDRRYDLNKFWASTAAQRNNLATGFLFEPGSTFKAFGGLAALDCGAVVPSDTFNGNDGINIAGHVIHNSENESFGTVTFAKTIQYSINVAMIRVAQLLGEDRLHDFLVDVGFGIATGIELPGEVNGILRDVDKWSKLDFASTVIGQSVGVTGIQLVRAMAAVANGGEVLVPHIVKQVGSETTDIPTVLRSVAATTSCDTMRSLMRAVVKDGTAPWADLPGFEVAGKTGTAQKAFPGQGYVDGKYTSLFAGFFPADAPKYLGLVVLDEVKTTPVWGGYTAGAIFHDAASRLVLAEHTAPVASWQGQPEQHKESTQPIQGTTLSSAASPPAWLQLP
ncbi:MAG TPA: penicillin-binding protein 2, partial [Candidatus Heimdallarchaeota archaeon]|nr:penicillin-binding protein 2 [Candidatus Heimdallarchaeota archaeon]